MKHLDYSGMLFASLAGATALAQLHRLDLQEELLAIMLIVVLLLSERSASMIVKSSIVQVGAAYSPDSLVAAIQQGVRASSRMLACYVPITMPANWKVVNGLSPKRRLNRCILQPVYVVWILSLYVIFSGSLLDVEGRSGIFSGLASGSEVSYVIAFILLSLLAWWSLSFSLIRLGIYWESK